MLSIRSILLTALAGTLAQIAPLLAAEPTGIFVMRIDGSDVKRVADVKGSPQLGAPRWSHDGQQVAFDAAAGTADATRWFLAHVDGSKTREMGYGGHVDWSPDDKQLVFDVRARVGSNVPVKPGIWVQNVDGQGRAWLAAGAAPRYSPAGDALAILAAEGLALFDLVELAPKKLNSPAGVLPGFDWSPDGKHLAVVTPAEGQRELWIVDASDAQEPKKLLAGDVDGYVAFSPDGKRLAISLAGKIQLLSVDGGAPEPIAEQQGVNRMPAWSADGARIAFASTRTSPALAPVERARRTVQLEEAKRHTRGNVVYGLDLSLDGRQVLLGGKKNVEIWNMDTDESQTLSLYGEWVTLSPDGRTAATCGPIVKIGLGDIVTGKPIRDLATGSMCTNVEFSADGSRVVCGTTGKTALAFDVASGKRLATFGKHDAPITRVAFLPNGEEAVSNGQDKALRIWNVQSGEERLVIPHPEVAWGLAVSPDGRMLATGTGGQTDGNPIMQRITRVDDNSIRLWDSTSGELIRELPGHTDVAYTLTFSPDGHTLASGGWDGTIRLWDVASGEQLAMIQGQGSAYAVAITPDGSQLVVGGGENRAAGGPLRRYPNEQVRVYRIVETE